MNLKQCREFLQPFIGKCIKRNDSKFSTLINYIQSYRNTDDIEKVRIRNVKGKMLMETKSFGSKRFQVLSWRKKATNFKPNTDILPMAMRYAVRSHSRKFRREHRIRVCAICGSTRHLEVDHKTPFKVIRTSFLQHRVDIPTDFQWKRRRWDLKKSPFKTAWQRYHRKHASFQYLCKPCNGRKGSSIPLSPPSSY